MFMSNNSSYRLGLIGAVLSMQAINEEIENARAEASSPRKPRKLAKSLEASWLWVAFGQVVENQVMFDLMG